MGSLESRIPPVLMPPMPVDIDEPVSVGISHYRNEHELHSHLRAMKQMARGRLAVVLGVRSDLKLNPSDLPNSVRIVPTAEPGDPNPRTFRAWCEPDPLRAVVLTMMSLRPNEGFILLLPSNWKGPSAEFLIDQGRRWRASLLPIEESEICPLHDGN